MNNPHYVWVLYLYKFAPYFALHHTIRTFFLGQSVQTKPYEAKLWKDILQRYTDVSIAACQKEATKDSI